MKSDCVRKGTEGAPKRALFHALGMTEEELNRPLVGIVNSYNEIVPGHMNLDKITEAVKIGVAMGGGTPVVFPAIAVCDGIAMGHQGMKYSLVTRDLIADSTEAMAIAHAFDALVMIPNLSLIHILYRRCEAEGMGISVMKPYSGGQLLDAETSPFGHALTACQCIQYAPVSYTHLAGAMWISRWLPM